MLYRLLVSLLVALPLMDWQIVQVGGKSIVAPYILAGLLAVAVLCYPKALRDQLRCDAAFPWLLAWLLVASAASVALFIYSGRPEVLAGNTLQLVNLAIMAGHYFFIAAALRVQPITQLTRLVALFVAVAGVGAVLSVYQLGSVVLSLPYWEFWRTSNLYYKAYTLNWHGGGSWITFPRAYGTAPEPTFWAGYLVCALGVALGRVGPGAPRRLFAPVVVILVALVTTFSRAAVPSAAAVLLVWAWVRWKRSVPVAVMIAILAVAIGTTVWPAFAPTRMMTVVNDHSAIERFSAQITGLRIVADYPFIGAGPGSVPFLVDKYLFVIEGRQLVAFSRLYSFFLVVMVASGILGTLIFMMFLAELARSAHARLRSDNPQIASLSLSALLCWVAIVVSWIGSPAYNMSYIWFCLALAAALPRSPAACLE